MDRIEAARGVPAHGGITETNLTRGPAEPALQPTYSLSSAIATPERTPTRAARTRRSSSQNRRTRRIMRVAALALLALVGAALFAIPATARRARRARDCPLAAR